MTRVARYRRPILVLAILAAAAVTAGQRTVWHNGVLVDLAVLVVGVGCGILAIVANRRRPASFLVVPSGPAFRTPPQASRVFIALTFIGWATQPLT